MQGEARVDDDIITDLGRLGQQEHGGGKVGLAFAHTHAGHALFLEFDHLGRNGKTHDSSSMVSR